MEVVFDDRERSLYHAFCAYVANRAYAEDVQTHCRRLDMADVTIRAADGPLIVVERKRLADLMSSVFDGRLSEQVRRMRDWQQTDDGQGAWVVLLVEGTAPDPHRFHGGEDRWRYFVKLSLQLALDANPAERRLLLRTGDERESAALLATLHRTLTAGADEAPWNRTAATLPRKGHDDVYLRQLCCTRGVSRPRAERIRCTFANMRDLVGRAASDNEAAWSQLVTATGSRVVAGRLWSDCALGPPPTNTARRKRAKK